MEKTRDINSSVCGTVKLNVLVLLRVVGLYDTMTYRVTMNSFFFFEGAESPKSENKSSTPILPRVLDLFVIETKLDVTWKDVSVGLQTYCTNSQHGDYDVPHRLSVFPTGLCADPGGHAV